MGVQTGNDQAEGWCEPRNHRQPKSGQTRDIIRRGAPLLRLYESDCLNVCRLLTAWRAQLPVNERLARVGVRAYCACRDSPGAQVNDARLQGHLERLAC